MRLSNLKGVFNFLEGRRNSKSTTKINVNAEGTKWGYMVDTPTISSREGSFAEGDIMVRGVSEGLCGMDEASFLTPDGLLDTMKQVAADVTEWTPAAFVLVKQLQEAIRNHGRVDLMRRKDSQGSQLVAVKRMPTRWITSGPEEFGSQYPSASERPWFDIGLVRYLNRLRFPFVCDLFAIFSDSQNTYVVTSLATEGDLFAWCEREPKPGSKREVTMVPLVTQIFAAVRCLHEVGVAHRDLSLENILLTDCGGGELRIKIIDFGMATLTQKCTNEVRGKQSYQAPEMHSAAKPYDAFSTDTFALGVVLFAMAAQDYPWISTKRGQCQLFEYVAMFGMQKFVSKRKLRRGNKQYLIEVFSPMFLALLSQLMELQCEQRASLGESCYATEKPSIWDAEWLGGVTFASMSEEMVHRSRLVGSEPT